jgi:PDZ domain-containing protein
MTQRWLAVIVAAPLLLALLVAAAAAPLPYAVYSPGPTFDVLGQNADEAELIQVDGHQAYYDDGQIRFTTVQTTSRDNRLSLMELMAAWADDDRAVIPFDVAHPEDLTAEEEKQQGQVAMASSQDVAKAVALTELGYDLTESVQVIDVVEGSAADGELLPGDVILEADGKRVEAPDDVVKAVTSHDVGDPVELVVRRDGKRLTVRIAPEEVDGEPRVGISVGESYDFPFEIKLDVDPQIGGPSAGLMFALGIYDTLTPGSLTGGETIAGTGALVSDGTVAPIGGIQQKIAGAEDAGAELFLVPKGNCEDVAGLDPDLRLVKAATMHDARLAVEQWADDPGTELPAC